jgi:putative phosphoesterase
MLIKIVVVSDSHGGRKHLQKIIDREQPFDYLIHCGDGTHDLEHVRLPHDVTVLSVAGNMDRAGSRERLIETALNGVNFMICHGDQFTVHYDYDRLLDEGLRRGADIICCGHTHIPCLHNQEVLLFNPGPADRGLYGIITLASGQVPVCEHKQL